MGGLSGSQTDVNFRFRKGKIDYLHGLRVYYSLGWEILFRFGCLKKVVLRAKFLVAFLGLLV